MKAEFEDYFIKKYPKIFVDMYGNPTQTCMAFGIETSDGWFWLIDNLCDSIQSYIDANSKKKQVKNKNARFFADSLDNARRCANNSRIKFIRKLSYRKSTFKFLDKIRNRFEAEEYETISQVIAVQVKEKYGSLRFYYNGGDKTIHGMVWLAEEMSYNICELCGSTKNVGRTKGWISTICEECKNSNEHFKDREWEKNTK